MASLRLLAVAVTLEAVSSQTWELHPCHGTNGVDSGFVGVLDNEWDRQWAQKLTGGVVCRVKVNVNAAGSWTSSADVEATTLNGVGLSATTGFATWKASEYPPGALSAGAVAGGVTKQTLTADGCESGWTEDAASKDLRKRPGFGASESVQMQTNVKSRTCYCDGMKKNGCNIISNFPTLSQSIPQVATMKDRCINLDESGGQYVLRRSDLSVPDEFTANGRLLEAFYNTPFDVTFASASAGGRTFYTIKIAMQASTAEGVSGVPEKSMDGTYYAQCLDGNAISGVPLWGVHNAQGKFMMTMSDEYTFEFAGAGNYKLAQFDSMSVPTTRAWNFFQIIALVIGIVCILGCMAYVAYKQLFANREPKTEEDAFDQNAPAFNAGSGPNTNEFGIVTDNNVVQVRTQSFGSGSQNPLVVNANSNPFATKTTEVGSFSDITLSQTSNRSESTARTTQAVETTGTEPLPANWRSAFDPNTNRTYYVSPEGQTQWTPPDVGSMQPN